MEEVQNWRQSSRSPSVPVFPLQVRWHLTSCMYRTFPWTISFLSIWLSLLGKISRVDRGFDLLGSASPAHAMRNEVVDRVGCWSRARPFCDRTTPGRIGQSGTSAALLSHSFPTSPICGITPSCCRRRNWLPERRLMSSRTRVRSNVVLTAGVLRRKASGWSPSTGWFDTAWPCTSFSEKMGRALGHADTQCRPLGYSRCWWWIIRTLLPHP